MKFNKRNVIGWIAVLAALLGYELFSAFDGNPGTPPLTDVTIKWVPWWLGLAFPAWLLGHFGRRYYNKWKANKQ